MFGHPNLSSRIFYQSYIIFGQFFKSFKYNYELLKTHIKISLKIRHLKERRQNHNFEFFRIQSFFSLISCGYVFPKYKVGFWSKLFSYMNIRISISRFLYDILQTSFIVYTLDSSLSLYSSSFGQFFFDLFIIYWLKNPHFYCIIKYKASI